MLRPFGPGDVARVTLLAGDPAIAATTIAIPHPYHEEHAATWIATHQPRFETGKGVECALALRRTGELIGAIGLSLNLSHDNAELGYWVGVPYWRHGYATEAGRRMLQYAFAELRLHRVYAHHFVTNPASGRVLQKLGMRPEGRRRHHVKKWEQFIGLEAFGILAAESMI